MGVYVKVKIFVRNKIAKGYGRMNVFLQSGTRPSLYVSQRGETKG